MKKPEEIKKGLETCVSEDGSCDDCPYAMEFRKDLYVCYNTKRAVMADALAYIQQLESGIEEWEMVAASPGAVEDMARENAQLVEEGEAAIRRAATLMERVEQIESQVPRWIPVEERLPEDMVDVLLYGEGLYGMGVLSNGWWCCEDFDGKHITHWMPLPEAPKEDAHAAD